MTEGGDGMTTDHQGREILLFDQLGNGGEKTFHALNLDDPAR